MPLDTQTIRKDFPTLVGGANHYLDSAATSLTPTSVIDAVDAYYRTYRAHVHRGLFKEAVRATEEYEGARQKVAAFIGADDSSEIIFVSGATEASNMFVRMFETSPQFWTSDVQNIVTTVMEHNASVVPLQELAKRTKSELRYIPLAGLELDYVSAEELIDEHTTLVAIMLTSNVTGMINDVRRISDIAHKQAAIVVVDATAAVGHIPVDVRALGADALYFSGHKMFAPTGIGVLWASIKLLEKLTPAIFGGHMINEVGQDGSTWAPVPARFEAGTKDIGGAIGLGAAIDYAEDIGIEAIHNHTAMLAFYAIHKLEQIPGITVFASCDPIKNVGTVSFIADWAHPHDIAEILARDRVAVRPGHHCAILLHKALDLHATTRASFHVYNTKADVDVLIAALEKAHKIFA